MKYLTFILLFISSNLLAQDYGELIEQRKYSGYSIEYHDDYDGDKSADGYIYQDDDGNIYDYNDGSLDFMDFKYNSIVVSIYEKKVLIVCNGEHYDSKSIYGKGDKITGPNWYGYELGGDMRLVISSVNTRIYSNPILIDGKEEFMMIEVFMNPTK